MEFIEIHIITKYITHYKYELYNEVDAITNYKKLLIQTNQLYTVITLPVFFLTAMLATIFFQG